MYHTIEGFVQKVTSDLSTYAEDSTTERSGEVGINVKILEKRKYMLRLGSARVLRRMKQSSGR